MKKISDKKAFNYFVTTGVKSHDKGMQACLNGRKLTEPGDIVVN